METKVSQFEQLRENLSDWGIDPNQFAYYLNTKLDGYPDPLPEQMSQFTAHLFMVGKMQFDRLNFVLNEVIPASEKEVEEEAREELAKVQSRRASKGKKAKN